MTQFATYRCTKCRRTKDILVDNVHALLSHCTITKGCSGTLQKIGEVESFTADLNVVDLSLVDWFPRGQEFTAVPVQTPTPMFGLGCSSNGVLCIASPNISAEEIVVEFERKTTFGISSQTFVKTIQTSTNTISGRDDQNRIIRFDQAAIDQNRIQVSLNGAQITDFGVTTNSITFGQQLESNTVVAITVFGEVPVEKISVTFTRNDSSSVAPPISAWSPITEFDRVSYSFPQGQSWAVFSAPNFSVSSTSELRISSAVTNEIFLLARSPYASVDRHTSAYVKLSDLTGTDFPLQKGSGLNAELLYPENLISSDAVPFRILFTPSPQQSTVAVDVVAIPNSKIIGPS